MSSNLALLRAASVAPADADIDFLLHHTTMYYFKRTPTRSYAFTKSYADKGHLDVYVYVYVYRRVIRKVELRALCPYDQAFVYQPLKDNLWW